MPPIQKKVCLLGDFAVGKTSLVQRYVYERFDEKYLSTIGVKVSRKTITIPRADNAVEMTIMLWDLAGSEKFDRMQASYLRGASGAVLVCDLTRSETLESLANYARDVWGVNPLASLVIVGNKVDLVDQRTITDKELAAMAAQQGQISHSSGNSPGPLPWFTSSAKTGENVERLFQILGGCILETR